MLRIHPSETILLGHWHQVAGKPKADETCKRIAELVESYFVFIAADESGWDKLFQDPEDGRVWELVYDNSDQHSGGPPTLKCVSRQEVSRKYGIRILHLSSMMKLLKPEQLNSWTQRFISFNDAVLKAWCVEYTPTSTILDIRLETQDIESPSGWSQVKFRLFDVFSMKYADGPKATYQVLSNGLHILFESDQIALEFGNFIDSPESFSELVLSPCHVVAEKLEWGVEPIAL